MSEVDRNLTDEEFDKMTAYLQGSAHSLITYLEEEFNGAQDLTAGDCARLDEHIFLCSVCSWWCEIDEEDSDGGDEFKCRDCVESERWPA